MKVYRITIGDPDEGTCYVWASSRRKVTERARELLDGMGREAEAIEGEAESVDVDANWLNTHFTRDNG